MSEEGLRKEIVDLLHDVHNLEWLTSIYSFIKVFADDKEEQNEEE